MELKGKKNIMDEELNPHTRGISSKKPKERSSSFSPRKLRNLAQYKDLPDEEFNELMDKKKLNIDIDRVWEDRIQRKMDELSKDYDLSDLKVNDIYSLRALASATLRLEDYDHLIGRITSDGVNDYTIITLDKIGKLQEGLRRGISQLQDDLKISRKIRKADKEESVVAFIDDLKKKARRFADQKMIYIFCPKCNNLLATVWVQYPDSKLNKLSLYCKRELDGVSCGTHFETNLSELWKKKQSSNNDNILPESMK